MSRASTTLIDSLNFFVQAADQATSILTVTASATGTFTGVSLTNTLHKGGMFFINLTTVAATCTVRFNLMGIDPVSGGSGVIGNISLDAISTGNIGNISWQVYPGIVTTVGTTNVEYHNNGIFSQKIFLQASITATASAGGAAVSFTTGLSKVV